LSRIHPVKRLDLVIQALRRCEGVSLVIAGVGRPSYLRELQGLAARLGLVHRILWAGQVSGEEKAALLRGAACLVQASSFESLGVAVLEAMAAGVPVAVSSRVGVADLVRRGGAGCVVGDSPDEWARVLQSLVTQPDLWQARAAGAVRWAEALPSMEDCGRELILRYEALLACAS
jgi:glycosyltransferase involved in cell wall biosynthesis